MKGTRLHIALIALALAASLLAGCGGGEATKAGGSGAPVTLRIGTNDSPDRPAARQIEEFARQVEELSGGKIRIEPVFRAAGEGSVDDGDQQVARMVVRGELDLGMIPARAWDTEGVTSLRALQAPFLVTTDELVDRVVTSSLAPRMLAGLDEAGVVGLALLPDSLRHPFGYGEPLLSPEDYAGKLVRALRSEVSYALFEALGATADDLPGDAFDQALADGSLAAAESAFVLGSSLRAITIATGNVTFFPRVNSLVVDADVFAALDEQQRGVLEEAAAQTLAWAIEATPTDAEAAQAFCEQVGGTVVVASETDLAALEEAAAPVYAELERDAETKSLIEAIRALESEAEISASAAPAPCGGSGTEAEATNEPSALDGVYRMSFSFEDLQRSPLLLDAGELNDGNWGDFTLTLDRERVTLEQENDVASSSTSGTFAVDGDSIVLEFTDGGNAGETFVGRWSLSQDTLTFTRDEALGILPTSYLVEPWHRVE